MQKKLPKNFKINLKYFLIFIFLAFGVSHIMLRKISYLSLPNYSLSEKSIKTLSKCSKILVVGKQYRPYLFTSSGIKVFSGFKRLNSNARQIFFEKLILQNKLLPYHHLELYERDYPLRLSSDILNLAGICHVVIPKETNLEEMIIRSKSEKDYDKKQLDIKSNSQKDKLNFLEFKNESSTIIVRNKKLSEIVFKDSYIDVADSILDNLAMVSNGNLIYISSQKPIFKKIKLVYNYIHIENERGFKLIKLEKVFNKEKNYYQDYFKFILLKQEVFSTSKAYCFNTNRKLTLLRVNLIQTIVEAPPSCKEIIVKI